MSKVLIFVLATFLCTHSLALAQGNNKELALGNLPVNTVFLVMNLGDKYIIPAHNTRNGVTMNIRLRCGGSVLYFPADLAPARSYAISCTLNAGKPAFNFGTDLTSGNDI